MGKTIREVLDTAENAKPIGELNGTKIASFEDAVALASADLYNSRELNPPEFNPDGSVAATPTPYAAVNVQMFYDNRFRKVGDEYQVVCGFKDYESIKGQSRGRVPTKQVVADVIGVDDKGKPVYKGIVTVSDTEFVSDFTHTFPVEDMKKIMPLVIDGQTTDVSKPVFK